LSTRDGKSQTITVAFQAAVPSRAGTVLIVEQSAKG